MDLKPIRIRLRVGLGDIEVLRRTPAGRRRSGTGLEGVWLQKFGSWLCCLLILERRT